MRAITIDAKSAESALRIAGALREFTPELIGTDKEGYRVTIGLGSSDRQVIAVLDALEEYVTTRQAEPAALELDGRQYTIHPRSRNE